jgi:hypothetical protein
MKEKEKVYWWRFSIVCAFLLLIGYYVIFIKIIYRFNQIEETLKDIPQKECHLEERLEKVILEPYDYGISEYGYDYNKGHRLIECEEGLYYMPGRIVNFNETHSKWCVIYIEEEICNIV